MCSCVRHSRINQFSFLNWMMQSFKNNFLACLLYSKLSILFLALKFTLLNLYPPLSLLTGERLSKPFINEDGSPDIHFSSLSEKESSFKSWILIAMRGCISLLSFFLLFGFLLSEIFVVYLLCVACLPKIASSWSSLVCELIPSEFDITVSIMDSVRVLFECFSLWTFASFSFVVFIISLNEGLDCLCF